MGVYKEKDKNAWYVKYKNKTKRGFKTKKDALEYEAVMRLKYTDEVLFVPIYDVINDFLRTYEGLVTYGTYHKTETILLEIVKPSIANKDIHRITQLECRKFRECIESKEYSTAYKNEILNSYKKLFKHSKKFFGLKEDPSEVIEPFKKKYEEKLKKKEKEFDIWTDEEFQQFINAVSKPVYKHLFLILYYTGMRLGEALALTWNDFEDGKLHITKSLTRKTKKGSFEIKEPKNVSSIRDVELGNFLNNILAQFEVKEMQKPGFDTSWFIFGGLKPLAQTNIDRAKENAIEKSKVKRIRMHDFRHSHASNLIANGVNIVAVSKRLGHCDVNMTLQVYTHLIKKNEDECTAYINLSSQNLLKNSVRI